MLKSIVAVGPIENIINEGERLLFPIGKDSGELLYKDSEDLKIFRNLTLDGIVIMGNSTYKSLPKKELDNRVIIVITTKPEGNVTGSIWDKKVWFLDIPKMFKMLSDVRTLVPPSNSDNYNSYGHLFNNEETDDMIPSIWVAGGSSIYSGLKSYIKTAYISWFYTEPKVVPNRYYQFDICDFMFKKVYYSGNNFDTIKYTRFHDDIRDTSCVHEVPIYSIFNKYVSELLQVDKGFKWVEKRGFDVIIIPKLYSKEFYEEKFVVESVFIKGFMDIIYKRIMSLTQSKYFKHMYSDITVSDVEMWLESLLQLSIINNFED